jgi:hypothetical protein
MMDAMVLMADLIGTAIPFCKPAARRRYYFLNNIAAAGTRDDLGGVAGDDPSQRLNRAPLRTLF